MPRFARRYGICYYLKVDKRIIHKLQTIALLLTGGAILLTSCSETKKVEEEVDLDKLMTQQADSLKIIQSNNGLKKYRFFAPLMEAYEDAREPFREFPKGIEVATFADSTENVESTLVADYAIQFIDQDFWEAKGNVVVTNANGNKLETQQLFWNNQTGKIYSNVDSKITQGNDVIIGVGFQSDDKFKDWEFRRVRGRVTVDVEPNRDNASDAPRPSSATPTAKPSTSVRETQGTKPTANPAIRKPISPSAGRVRPEGVATQGGLHPERSEGTKIQQLPGNREIKAISAKPMQTEQGAIKEDDGKATELTPQGGAK